MKIVVCVKTTPDTTAVIKVDGGRVGWGEAPLVINPWDEYATEAALQLKEAQGGTVIALSVGGEEARIGLKHALAMGADEAVQITDPGLEGADPGGVARVLVAAIQKMGGAEVALFGRQAIDDDSGTTAAQAARLLGWAGLTLASVIKVEGGNLRVERAMEEGRQVVVAKLPAVLSVVKDFGSPRSPSFLGIRKASRTEIPVWGLGDLGIAAPAAGIVREELREAPTREVVCEMITGSSPEEVAERLAEKILVEQQK
ncbi:MAG: electron transfer flavoprotein subunit beta/FixA family protein [Anaerolineales bacterium]